MKLAAIHADLHVFDGEVNFGAPLRLLLRFKDGAQLRLQVAGDGEGMVLDRLPLEAPFDMGECGRVDRFDVTARLFPALAGAPIERLRAIDIRAGKRIGLALCRAGGEAFCFWVDGDAFHWGTASALAAWSWPPGEAPAIADEIVI